MILRSWFRKLFARPAADPIRPSPKEAVMRTLMAVVVPALGVLVYAALPVAADQGSAERAGGGLVARLQDLDLTDEQEAKITDIRKEHPPELQEAARELAAVVREEMGKIRDVLSEEQKAKLLELKDERKERVRDRTACRIANLKDLDLTDEQKTKIADIRKEYRPKVQEAGNKLRATVTDGLEAIVAVIRG